ncbi:MAG: hypothetical protein IJU29_04400, partial [Oscillospiraceae bacterium]|nr:hypothetical protein [Oscillospiraceae bacterium]
KGNIESFAIEFTDRRDRGGIMDVRPEILERLKQLPEIGFWNCGFSMDENDVVSFHVVPRPLRDTPGPDASPAGGCPRRCGGRRS